MAHELIEQDLSQERASIVIHYNMLRPFDNKASLAMRPLNADPVWTLLRSVTDRIRAVVVVAPRSTIAKRALLRSSVEPDFRDNKSIYPSKDIFEYCMICGVESICQQWLDELQRAQIPLTL